MQLVEVPFLAPRELLLLAQCYVPQVLDTIAAWEHCNSALSVSILHVGNIRLWQSCSMYMHIRSMIKWDRDVQTSRWGLRHQGR